jgi:hypothetical protein
MARYVTLRQLPNPEMIMQPKLSVGPEIERTRGPKSFDIKILPLSY